LTFNDSIAWLVENLPKYQPLQDYAQEHFDRVFTVTRKFKPRDQLQPADLPLIMVTRPKVAKTYKTGARDGSHTISLYVGFFQPDEENEDALEKAQIHTVRIEELIDDFFMANYNLGSTVQEAMPTTSENDEGFFHPVYFNRMDVIVNHRRSTL